MKHHLKIFILFLGVCVTNIEIHAQHLGQMGQGNYNMISSYRINPSLSAFSLNKWQLSPAAFWVNQNNTYLSLYLPYSFYKLPNRVPQTYRTESGNLYFSKNWLKESINGRNKH